MKELSCLTEAMVCSVLFAALSKLRTVELYAKPLPVEPEGDRRLSHGRSRFGPIDASNYKSDVSRLAQGLATTSITSLTLSTDLNGLHASHLPTLTTLTLDYSGPNQFVTVAKGCFTNVTILKIQSLGCYSGMRLGVSEKLPILYRGLPNLRVLEFGSGKVAVFTPQVKTIVFREADWDAREWVRNFLVVRRSPNAGAMALKSIVMHWRKNCSLRPLRWCGGEQLAKEAGVKVVIMWHGKLAWFTSDGNVSLDAPMVAASR
jgi:hypothetical protein